MSLSDCGRMARTVRRTANAERFVAQAERDGVLGCTGQTLKGL